MEGNVYRIFKNKSNGLDYFNEKEGRVGGEMGQYREWSRGRNFWKIALRKEKFLLESIPLESCYLLGCD